MKAQIIEIFIKQEMILKEAIEKSRNVAERRLIEVILKDIHSYHEIIRKLSRIESIEAGQ